MNKKLLLVLLTVCAFGCVRAKDTSESKVASIVQSKKKPAIDRLLEITFNKDVFFTSKGREKLKDNMLTTMQTLAASLQGGSLTAEQILILPGMNDLTSNYLERIEQEMFSEDVKKRVKEVYAKRYTEQEINELIKFYESSLGQKVLKIQPEVSDQITDALAVTAQKRLNDFAIQAAQLVEEHRSKSFTKVQKEQKSIVVKQ